MAKVIYPYFENYAIAESYPLMESPVPLVVILLAYLWIVKFAGPK